MKCWICGAEMKNTIGGNYTCENCHMAAIDDCVLRYPNNFQIIQNSPLIIESDGDKQNENSIIGRIN